MLTPQQIKEIEEFVGKLNNSTITGHISGRHLILVGGEQDRKWTGGDYEENEYRFLDEYIKSFIITTINNILAERDKEIKKYIDDEYKRGDTPVIASRRCRYAKMTETIGESRARHSGWLSGLLTVRDRILNIK